MFKVNNKATETTPLAKLSISTCGILSFEQSLMLWNYLHQLQVPAYHERRERIESW